MTRSAPTPLDIVIIGLTVTSSWGNGHATTYRSLIKGLLQREHNVTFLERNNKLYSETRDLAEPLPFRLALYEDFEQLQREWSTKVAEADLVIVGSFIQHGAMVGDWVVGHAHGIVAFYDIDTPVTLAKFTGGEHNYLRPDLIPKYHIYLSVAGGPTLALLEQQFGSPKARPFYCSVDPDIYYEKTLTKHLDLGYLGTYSPERQSAVERMLLKPARSWAGGQFQVAGAYYPDIAFWPGNVRYVQHVPPPEHCAFYNAQRFTLNVTRPEMVQAGWSASVRLFEAAACGTPIISDFWLGLDELFEPGREILVCNESEEVLDCLRSISRTERTRIGRAAQQRVLNEHTGYHRAIELENHLAELK